MHLHLGINPSQPHKPTEKQITNIICKIQQQGHDILAYRQLLQNKEQLEKTSSELLSIDQLKILDIRQWKNLVQNNRQSIGNDGGYCEVCFQEVNGKSYTCRVCKRLICRNCVGRQRELKNGDLVKFCEKCDKQFLQAMINKDFLEKKLLLEQTFQTLIREQETLETLVNKQKQKALKQSLPGSQAQQVLSNQTKVNKLKAKKNNLLEEISETKIKIKWGESITRNLKHKHKKLSSLLKESFGSVNSGTVDNMNGTDKGSFWQGPKATSDSSLEVENINESLVASILQTSNQESNSNRNSMGIGEEVKQGDDGFFKNTCKCEIM